MNINFISRCSTKSLNILYRSAYSDKNYVNILKRFSNYTIAQHLTSNDSENWLLRRPKCQNHGTGQRTYCTENNSPVRKQLPPLMKFPEIVWPSLLKSLRNFILTHFIIKPYFDREFDLPDFISGTKKAVEVVSAKLSEGDISTLNGLVAGEVVPELQKAVAQMSLSQRQQISINKDDMYFSFPYQIGIMFDDEENKPQKRFVEITMVYHVLRGLDAIKSKGEDLPLNVGMLPQYRDNISICNYRFIKEFTKGSESDWTINLLNHFKPSDYIDQ